MRDQRLQGAAKLLMSGQRDQAEALLQAFVQEQPQSAEAWHLLGLASLQAGQHPAALHRLQQAVRLGPQIADHHYNLAGAYYALKRWQEAAAAYQSAADLGSHFFEAWKGLGASLLKLGRGTEAEAALRRSLQINVKQSLVWVDLADALSVQKRWTEAIEGLQRALALEEGCVEAHRRLAELFKRTGHRQNEATAYYNLGSLFWREGKRAEAMHAFEQTLALNPTNGRARHGLASLRGETPSSAPREYVVDLFDKYAAHFDSHLAMLQYRVPELMREAVLRQGAHANASQRVLDLGCGSGKGGTLFRELASFLCGIDVAPRMLEQSKHLDVYDDLILGDIAEVLRTRRDKFDLILAADVFIYVGALEEVFDECQRVCAGGGLFVFSVEAFDGEGYCLRPSGRFAHSQRYVISLAVRHGFELLSEEAVIIRQQQDGTIPGWLYVIRKAAF